MATQTQTQTAETETQNIAVSGERDFTYTRQSIPDEPEQPPGRLFQTSGFVCQGGEGGGGGGGGGGSSGGGGGGDDSDNDPDAIAAQAANGKLNGKEPTIFTGDRKVAEAFLLEWRIYQLVNHGVSLMRQAFTRATLFLSFIKGPDVHEWATAQVQWLMSRL